MSPINNDDYLSVAVEAAFAASHIIMDALDKPRVADHKGKTDLVTKTDHVSENTIKSIIRSSFPDHSFLAEESGQDSSKSDYLWIIDPLDGTTNFVHGYPSFGVSIGLFHRNKPVIGVVMDFDEVVDVVEEVREDERHGGHVATEFQAPVAVGGLMECLDRLAPQPGLHELAGELFVVVQPVIHLTKVEKRRTAADDRLGEVLASLPPVGNCRRVFCSGQIADFLRRDLQVFADVFKVEIILRSGSSGRTNGSSVDLVLEGLALLDGF